MTNAEYYLKEGIDCGEFVKEFEKFALSKPEWEHLSKRGLLALFLEKQRKPTLTEDERVILSNLSKDYIFIGKKDKFLYIKADKENEDYFAGNVRGLDIIFPNLFQFIKEGEEYDIQELLK